MNAQELRIGNWVMDAGNDYIKVRSIDLLGINTALHIDGMSYSHIYRELSPIPLTPEILEKAGFEFLTKWEPFSANDGLTHKLDVGVFKFGVGMMSSMVTLLEQNGYSLGVHVTHLHQLQNLYFALTGEELEIKF